MARRTPMSSTDIKSEIWEKGIIDFGPQSCEKCHIKTNLWHLVMVNGARKLLCEECAGRKDR